MKKTYISPMVVVTQVVTNYHLCFGSLSKEKAVEGLDENLVDGGNNPGSFSRRNDRWEDEEEDDVRW